MSDDDVLVERDGAVATVTLNRPATLNAMTRGMQVDYCRALVALDADPEVRVVVVTGAGRGFCAGADLTQDGGEGSFGGGVRAAMAEGADVPLDAPLRMRTPTIAAINGPSAGMGTAYALMADVRFAAASARIGTTFARLGLVAEWGMAHTLVGVVGQSAADLLLSGRYVDAPEALAIGLVSRVLPDAELLPAARAWADEVAAGTSPFSHAMIKEQLRRVAAGESREEGFRRSVTEMLESFGRPDLAAAVEAYRARRPPTFPAFDPAP